MNFLHDALSCTFLGRDAAMRNEACMAKCPIPDLEINGN